MNLSDFAAKTEEQYASLKAIAMTYEDAQKMRVSAFNRMGLTKNGKLSAAGIYVDPVLAEMTTKSCAAMERQFESSLVEAFMDIAPPALIEMVETTDGLGFSTMAKFIGTLGHPRIAIPIHNEGKTKIAGEPYLRRLNQLNQYCGVGDASFKRRRGNTEAQNRKAGNRALRTYLWQLAQFSAVQTRKKGEMSDIYATYRVRQGDTYVPGAPSGKRWIQGPNKWAHAQAHRYVAKVILERIFNAYSEPELD